MDKATEKIEKLRSMKADAVRALAVADECEEHLIALKLDESIALIDRRLKALDA